MSDTVCPNATRSLRFFQATKDFFKLLDEVDTWQFVIHFNTIADVSPRFSNPEFRQYFANTRPFANNASTLGDPSLQVSWRVNWPVRIRHVSSNCAVETPIYINALTRSSSRDASVVPMSANQRMRRTPTSQGSDPGDSGLFNERILVLLFKYIKWDIQTLCLVASVNRKLQAIVTRLLWREVCVCRAPRMVATLTRSAPSGRIGGGWRSLAKLMFFCCGCESTRHFRVSRSSAGHFVKETRFSKTSGRSFLSRRCRGDVLYVSDPCEHPMGNREDDLGIYRGVFEGFIRSRTRAYLIGRQVELEEIVRCPYCGARVWSMTAARLIPKSAARRLGSLDGGLEYFVCVNGHLHGTCWLVPLSSDEEKVDDDDDEDGNGDDDDFAGDVGAQSVDYDDLTAVTNGRMIPNVA